MFAHAGVLLESRCVGAASSRASSSVFFCVKWLFLLRSGSFLFRSTLNCKPLLECSCFIPGDVENAMTAFSLTTRDIVEAIHRFATAFIGTHWSLDEAVPRWGLPLPALKRRIWQRFFMLLHSSSKLLTDFTGIDDDNLEEVPRNTWCFCPIIRVSFACKVKHFKLEILLHFMVHVVDSSKKLIEDTSCLQCLTHFETFRDKQVTCPSWYVRLLSCRHKNTALLCVFDANQPSLTTFPSQQRVLKEDFVLK